MKRPAKRSVSGGIRVNYAAANARCSVGNNVNYHPTYSKLHPRTRTANCANLKMTVFLDVVPFSLVKINQHFTVACCPHHHGDDLMMEAASTSETSVNLFQTTWHNITEQPSLYSPI
jgi:hypothetical protein